MPHACILKLPINRFVTRNTCLQQPLALIFQILFQHQALYKHVSFDKLLGLSLGLHNYAMRKTDGRSAKRLQSYPRVKILIKYETSLNSNFIHTINSSY